jgi:hypothetical protein
MAFEMNVNTPNQSLDTVALILGALTAGGGITGYARTGSVPSIAAGVTVGSLVCPHSIYNPHPVLVTIHNNRLTIQLTSPPVHPRRLAHPLSRPVRCRTCTPSFHHSRWKFDPPRTEDAEAASGWTERFGAIRIVVFRYGFPKGHSESLRYDEQEAVN